MANSVKRGTVVHVDGKTVGVNASGEKVGGDGPDKDKLKVETVLDLHGAQIRAVAGEDKRNEFKVVKPSQIKPGDRISAAWADDRRQVSAATLFPAPKDEDEKAKAAPKHLTVGHVPAHPTRGHKS